MKKLLIAFMSMILCAGALYAEDDDSTPYMPFPVQPPQAEQPKTETAKKAPAKKKTSKKKAAPKKRTARKTATRKTVAPKPQTSLEKGIALMKEERYEAAKPYLLRAIQENKNDPNAWYWYGVYHEKTGGFYQAQYFYSKAVTVDPAFDPLSRAVYYPNDSEKTPLWDPKRPARVYPVAAGNKNINIGTGNFPSAPNDPEIPKVPVYTPPEPGSSPLEGDSWTPSVYVPPSPEEVQIHEGVSPVYMPPDAGEIVAEPHENYSYKIPGYSTTYVNEERDPRLRADVPLYNPPAPGQTVTQAPAPRHTAPKVAKAQPKSAKKETATAPRKVVKQSGKKKTAPKKSEPKKSAPAPTPAKKTPVQAKPQPQEPKRTPTPTPPAQTARPAQPRQTQPQPTPPRRETPKPVEPVKPVERVEREAPQPDRQQIEYLPPVGQFAPDPGTVPDDMNIPPVGQRAQ